MSKHTPVKLCPECHHRPSMRDGDPAYCHCKCHDVADAAPDLLAVVQVIDDTCGNELYTMARAALAKAESQ